MKIAIDIGHTLFGPKDTTGERELFPSVIESLSTLQRLGHELIIISKIPHGDKTKVLNRTIKKGIVPSFVAEGDVHFCYEREEKGPIAKQLGVDVMIDDRVQVHDIMAANEIPHRILFLEGHDDRKFYTLNTSVIEAHNWCEVVNIIQSLPQ